MRARATRYGKRTLEGILASRLSSAPVIQKKLPQRPQHRQPEVERWIYTDAMLARPRTARYGKMQHTQRGPRASSTESGRLSRSHPSQVCLAPVPPSSALERIYLASHPFCITAEGVAEEKRRAKKIACFSSVQGRNGLCVQSLLDSAHDESNSRSRNRRTNSLVSVPYEFHPVVSKPSPASSSPYWIPPAKPVFLARATKGIPNFVGHE